jgi:hypothetical protein
VLRWPARARTATATTACRAHERGPGGEVVLLDQQNAKSAAGRVTGTAGAVDAAADDGKVVLGHARLLLRSG